MLRVLQIYFSVLFLFLGTALFAQDGGICQAKYAEKGVAESFVAGKQWFPYPAYSDREGWDALFGSQKQKVIKKGEDKLDYQWKTIPATVYLAFERTGDRSEMEGLQNANVGALLSLMFAELAEGKGRFIDQIANGVWLSAQQFSWVWSAHQVRQGSKRSLPDSRDHFIDLGSGNYGAVMSVAYYFFHEEFDKLDPSISYAVKNAVKEHILDPFLDKGKYGEHPWLGLDKKRRLNNWTPWCNASVVLCFLLLEDDQDRLNACMDMSVRSIDEFLSSIQKDGSCEEGITYWYMAAGRLYEWLQILYDASDGKFSLYDNERLRKYGEFPSRAYIGDGYYVNFADGSAKTGVLRQLVWGYGRAVGSKEMTDFAMYWLADRSKENFKYPSIGSWDYVTGVFRPLQDIRFDSIMREAVDSLNNLVRESSFDEVLTSLREGVPAVTWYEETENAFFRNPSNWFLGAKGGYNAESHNHNDIGSCVLYIRNIPVLIDAGVGTYSRQTFATNERYKIWTMQCDWHNLPMPNGVAQPYGKNYRSRDVVCSPDKGRFSLNLVDAYPEEANCRGWTRTYSLAFKGEPSLTINDTFTLSERTGADVEHFLVKGEVVLPGEEYNGKILNEGELLVLCDDGLVVKLSFPKKMKASVDVKELNDAKLSRVWGQSVRRINLTSSDTAPVKSTYEFKFTELK